MSKWIPISKGLPKIGSVIIVTIIDHANKRNELRYPVYYEKKRYGGGYGFFLGDYYLMPDMHEVVAWMPIPHVYGDCVEVSE